jgi:KDO2-lipid IV(A) lauroyltransferase
MIQSGLDRPDGATSAPGAGFGRSGMRSVPPVPLRFRLEAAAARASLALLRALGPVAASNGAGLIARTLGPPLPVSRVADANLRVAFPAYDAAKRRAVIRGVWENLGRTLGELPHIPSLARDTPAGPGWEVEGEEILAEVAAAGGPAILFSGHFGNWEVLPAIAAACGAPFSSLYRASANPMIDGLIRDLRRQAMGVELPMFPKGAQGARAALVHMSRGGRLGLLMDQKMNDGINATFFGRPAMTAPALAVLALRFRCPVVPGYIRRIGPARFRLVVEPPLALPDTGDRASDVALLTQAVNDRLEAWIRQWPEGWLWLHRRWPKGQPHPA